MFKVMNKVMTHKYQYLNVMMVIQNTQKLPMMPTITQMMSGEYINTRLIPWNMSGEYTQRAVSWVSSQ